jgi:hypothetical protein
MKYKKLNDIFVEICKIQNKKPETIKNKLIINYINDNIDKIKSNSIYYMKNDPNKKLYVIIGDDGEYFELNDGSIINKDIFEKTFLYDDMTSIKVNPNDFFKSSPLEKIANELKQKIEINDKINSDNFFKPSITKKMFNNLKDKLKNS